MWLRSSIVAVVQAAGYSSHWTPTLGTSICHWCGPKRQKKKERKQDDVTWNEGMRSDNVVVIEGLPAELNLSKM